MEFVSITYLIWLIVLLSVAWISANKYSPHILTFFGIVFVFIQAPLGGAVLLTESLLSYFIIHQRKKTRWLFSIFFIILIFVAFLMCKYYAERRSIILPLGISYYTFRLIHYVQDNLRQNIRKHTFIEFLAYMTFFPTFLVGPINLFPDFLTNIRRRKWDYTVFSKGLERMFYGYAQLIILGNYIVNNVLKEWFDNISDQSGDTGVLIIQSIHLWLDLYIRFSAYSSIAIGISAMIGFKVPENFNYPFFATNIKEFWNRWHMSLTGWCRDYIFIPLAAVTRKPFLAIGVTMITIGIWHELSIRYILWGIYHSVGIIIFEKWSTITKDKLPESKVFQKAYNLISILFTILFVVMSFPVTTIITNFLNSLIP